jgi:hypothetical protein
MSEVLILAAPASPGQAAAISTAAKIPPQAAQDLLGILRPVDNASSLIAFSLFQIAENVVP